MLPVLTRHFPYSPSKTALSNNFRIRSVSLIVVCIFLCGCEGAKKPLVEVQPSPTAPPQDQPLQMSKLPPPEINSVQAAVKRVFKDSAQIDTSRTPAFIVGDFNGDNSQDVAVVLKPVPEKLGDLNVEFPRWLLREPVVSNEPRVPRLRVAADEILLAIIHGYGDNGWRDQQATQTFLLKNAVSNGMAVHQQKDAAMANQGKKQPQLRGDVISATLGGSSGYLYYSNASYRWYDPKTFKGDPEPGMFHGVARKVKK